MGTSFSEFRGVGFWTRDSALETALASLVVALEPMVESRPWLNPLLDHWALQASAGFGGCVSPGLDQHLTSPEHVTLIAGCAAQLAGQLATGPEFVAVDEAFCARARKALHREPGEQPTALTSWVVPTQGSARPDRW